ncbi:alpha/beta fold hydrolase [Streptomyces sp. NPDC049879]|uniref:alpha/beta fold hydrolase n=1 Tax=Streptomyces sp. NPDC049879 TaxID=3365598 RepID=UPI0037948099
MPEPSAHPPFPQQSARRDWAVRIVPSTGGARLHTEIHGPDDAPTVVLVHGWTCNTALWHGVLHRLLPDHRVVLYDQRGHGRTPPTPGNCDADALADDLCAVLDATVPDGARAVVAGHSMGAMTVVAAAGRPQLAERAAAALLCSTGIDRLTGESTVLPLRPGGVRLAGQRFLLTNRLRYGPPTPLSRRLVHRITLGPGATRTQRAAVTRMVSACAPRPRAEWGRVLSALDLTERAAALDLPVTLLQGTADRLTPPVHAHRLAALLPRRPEFAELPGIGHMTPFEAPGRVADVVRGLVKEHL